MNRRQKQQVYLRRENGGGGSSRTAAPSQSDESSMETFLSLMQAGSSSREISYNALSTEGNVPLAMKMTAPID